MSGAQADSGARPVLQHRGEEATGSLHTARALGWGTVGDFLHSFPGTPPATHIAATSWWKRASDCPFLHGVVSATSGYSTWWQAQVCPWDRWPRDAVPLGLEAQDRHAFCPGSFLRVEHAPCPTHPLCLLSSQASVSLHRERVHMYCHRLLFLPGQAHLLPYCLPTTRPMAPSLLLGRRAAPSPDVLHGSVVTDVSHS